MANEESFINEVTEEVRREKLYRYAKRYGWIAGLLVVLLVGGAAWNEYRKAQIRAAAEARGDAILAAIEAEAVAARASGIAGIDGEGATRAVLDLLAAGQSASDPSARDAALDRLNAVADDPALPLFYSHLARLKVVALRGTALTPAERLEALEPLTVPGAPYRVLALEAMAHAHVAAGDTEAALSILSDIVGDSETTQGLRQRASQLIVALGGSLETG